MRLILFDIDGTLIHSGGAGLRSLRKVFHEMFDLEDAVEGIAFHGRTDPAIVREIAKKCLGPDPDDARMAEITKRYLVHLQEFLRDPPGYQVLSGAHSLVADLAEDPAVVLGLATGNYEVAAYAKLRPGQLDGFFDLGGFGSDSESRPELTRIAVSRGRERAGAAVPVVVVGDTIHDVHAAHEAGARCLAVATGNASMETLEEAGADWTVPTLEDPRAREVLELASFHSR
ncbi:MAG: HAD hydrolase-like protein [Gemmatimonadota bacterium]|nr:HAD hydrolase-like protein [Gemmatimonadota bacterium]MDP6802557.1 HAD hydrolase-like protein [Gemmatimonadota bacterium]MDP7031820.1 HAD hydrolase-like protein [Gemmatimonadota bacterium]